MSMRFILIDKGTLVVIDILENRTTKFLHTYFERFYLKIDNKLRRLLLTCMKHKFDYFATFFLLQLLFLTESISFNI
ncbi:transposase (fragment) [Staphylococcus aureus]